MDVAGGNAQAHDQVDAAWGGSGHDHLWGGYGADYLDVRPRSTSSVPGIVPTSDPETWFQLRGAGRPRTTVSSTPRRTSRASTTLRRLGSGTRCRRTRATTARSSATGCSTGVVATTATTSVRRRSATGSRRGRCTGPDRVPANAVVGRWWGTGPTANQAMTAGLGVPRDGDRVPNEVRLNTNPIHPDTRLTHLRAWRPVRPALCAGGDAPRRRRHRLRGRRRGRRRGHGEHCGHGDRAAGRHGRCRRHDRPRRGDDHHHRVHRTRPRPAPSPAPNQSRWAGQVDAACKPWQERIDAVPPPTDAASLEDFLAAVDAAGRKAGRRGRGGEAAGGRRGGRDGRPLRRCARPARARPRPVPRRDSPERRPRDPGGTPRGERRRGVGARLRRRARYHRVGGGYSEAEAERLASVLRAARGYALRRSPYQFAITRQGPPDPSSHGIRPT